MVALTRNLLRSNFAWSIIFHNGCTEAKMSYLNKQEDGRLFEIVLHNNAAWHIITNNGCTVWEQLLDLPTNNGCTDAKKPFQPSLASSRLLETIWQDLSTYSFPLCSTYSISTKIYTSHSISCKKSKKIASALKLFQFDSQSLICLFCKMYYFS